MTDRFASEVIASFVGTICREMGFERIEVSALEVFQDVVLRYIRTLGTMSRNNAQSTGRSLVNLHDVLKALTESEQKIHPAFSSAAAAKGIGTIAGTASKATSGLSLETQQQTPDTTGAGALINLSSFLKQKRWQKELTYTVPEWPIAKRRCIVNLSKAAVTKSVPSLSNNGDSSSNQKGQQSKAPSSGSSGFQKSFSHHLGHIPPGAPHFPPVHTRKKTLTCAIDNKRRMIDPSQPDRIARVIHDTLQNSFANLQKTHDAKIKNILANTEARDKAYKDQQATLQREKEKAAEQKKNETILGQNKKNDQQHKGTINGSGGQIEEGKEMDILNDDLESDDEDEDNNGEDDELAGHKVNPKSLSSDYIFNFKLISRTGLEMEKYEVTRKLKQAKQKEEDLFDRVVLFDTANEKEERSDEVRSGNNGEKRRKDNIGMEETVCRGQTTEEIDELWNDDGSKEEDDEGLKKNDNYNNGDSNPFL
eukprot:g2919.t1